MLSANLVVLGEYTVAYALSDEELNAQTAETNHDNVEFNSYFTTNSHIATFDVGSKEAKLFVQINVNNAGYLENGLIEFQNTNFKISEDITNSNIQSIDRENNRIYLNKINNGQSVTLEIPIAILESETISEDYFNKETTTKFTGTYMDGRGEETEINKQVTNKLSWKNTAEIEATVEATKFIPYATGGNYGVLVQTKVNSKVKNNLLPVKTSNIEITVPTINNVKPTSVTVVAVSTEATNGKDNGLEFANGNYSYDAQTGKLSINTTNNAGTVSWKKNATDEYLVNYIFEGQEIYNYANSNGMDSTITVIPNISVYNGEETILTKTVTTPIKYEEKDGAITDFKVSLPESISKGYIYSNFDTNSKVETEYFSKYVATINAAKLVTTVEFIQDTDKFLNAEDEESSTNISGTNYAYNKRIEIAQAVFNKMLGEDGIVTIKNNDGTELGKIDKNTQLENGVYVLDISDKNSNNLNITTTAPITEGQIEINIVKAIKGNIGYSKEQVIEFEKLSAHLQGKTNTTTFDSTTQTVLVEPETKVELELDKTSLTTVVENENVEIRAILDTSSIYNALFKNPTLKITFPENVEKVTLNSSNLVLANGLKIKSAKVETEGGRQVINVELEGTQTEYTIDAEYKGAIVILDTNITVSTLTSSSIDKITMRYDNNNDIAISPTGTVEKEINFVAPSGITTATGLSNYQEGATPVLSISDEPQTVNIDTYSDARTATMSGTIINNYQNDISGIVVLGRLPAQGNTKIDTNTDMGSNFTIPLSEGLKISGVETTNYKIYYSDNQNATKELSNSSNGWSETPTTASKSYMIVFNTNYKLAGQARISFEYDLEIPANLEPDKSSFAMYKVYYTNNSAIGSVEESKVAAIIGLTTGKGPKLEVELQSTSGTNVKEGQYIRMKAIVKNVGEVTATNVVLTATAPEYTSFVEYHTSSGFSPIEGTTMTLGVGTIAAGESRETTYYLKIDSNIKTSLPDDQVDENYNFTSNIRISVNAIADEINNKIKSNDVTFEVTKGDLSLNLISSVPSEDVVNKNSKIEFIVNIRSVSLEAELSNVIVQLKLPNGITFESGTVKEGIKDVTSDEISFDESTGIITININTLEYSKRILLEVLVENIEGTYDIQATATADGIQEHVSNIIELKAEMSHISVAELTSSPKYVKENELLTYNLKIKNDGTAVVQDIKITDTLPEGVEFEYATYNYAGQEHRVTRLKNGNIDFTIAQLNPGEEISIDIVVRAGLLPDQNDKTIENSVTISSRSTDAITTNTVTNIIEYDADAHKDEDEDPNNPTVDRYKITGTAWIDENRDGKRDNNEQTVSGIEVILLNKGATSIVKDIDSGEEKRVTTGTGGRYEFNNLTPGQYLVLFLYESSQYSLTDYQKENIAIDVNSDVIDINVTLDGVRRIAAITDVITIDDDNVRDIDIGLYAAEKFDLKLDKFVDKLTLTTPTIGTRVDEYDDAKIARTDVLSQNLGKSSVAIEYKIRVTNEGSVAGYVRKVVDYLPEGVTFSTELNPDWYLSDNGNIYNSTLENEKLNPGETKELKLIVTMQITEDKLGILNNSAEIYEAYNEKGLEDIDSTPGNMADNEDDMSSADVSIFIVTGSQIILYISIAIGILALIGFGIYEIRKHVLIKNK